MFFEFPNDPATFTLEEQHMLGSDLLIRPVTSASTDTAKIYLAGSEVFLTKAKVNL
jgi:alpha 1,3-glucosidase